MQLELAPAEPTTVGGQKGPVADGRVRVDGKRLTRDGRGFRIHGVTYGPFSPGPDGLQFLSPDRTRDDFSRMREAEVNSLRTYHIPPEWFLHLSGDNGLSVFVDVPWPKHLCFLDSL